MMPSPFIVLLAAALGLSVCLVRAQQALQVGYPSQPPVVCGMTQLLWSSSVGKTNVSVVAAGKNPSLAFPSHMHSATHLILDD